MKQGGRRQTPPRAGREDIPARRGPRALRWRLPGLSVSQTFPGSGGGGDGRPWGRARGGGGRDPGGGRRPGRLRGRGSGGRSEQGAAARGGLCWTPRGAPAGSPRAPHLAALLAAGLALGRVVPHPPPPWTLERKEKASLTLGRSGCSALVPSRGRPPPCEMRRARLEGRKRNPEL